MVEVIPAIIPQNYAELVDSVTQVKDFVRTVQIDVIDGIYAPRASWPYNNVDAPQFRKLIEEQTGLPWWELLDYEIDMMVEKPEERMDDWISAGAKTLIIHLESTEEHESIFGRAQERGIDIALAIKPSTDTRLLAPWVGRISFIQCMGNDKIGEHGISLDESVLGKISELQTLYSGVTIGIDIGVSKKTAPRLIEAGVTRLAAGSAIFESPDIKNAIEILKNS